MIYPRRGPYLRIRSWIGMAQMAWVIANVPGQHPDPGSLSKTALLADVTRTWSTFWFGCDDNCFLSQEWTRGSMFLGR